MFQVPIEFQLIPAKHYKWISKIEEISDLWYKVTFAQQPDTPAYYIKKGDNRFRLLLSYLDTKKNVFDGEAWKVNNTIDWDWHWAPPLWQRKQNEPELIDYDWE